MAESLRQRVVNLLVDRHGINRAQLEKILKSPESNGRSLGQLVVEKGLCSQQELVATLAKGLTLPTLNLSRVQIDPALAQVVPEKIARQHRLVPVSRIGNHLSVAMADPLNVLALDDLTLSTGLELSPVIASEKDVEEAIQQLYPHPMAPDESAPPASLEGAPVEEASGVEDVVDLTALGISGRKAPIVEAVNLMILEALKARASDIHVEPYEKEIRIRYRVDGSLMEVLRLPKRYQSPVITRLKIMARLDITENRLPQDGRFKVRVENREVDFRVSVLPVSFGNKVVMRLLDKGNFSIGLDRLGFLPDSLAAFRKAIAHPYGMILVTGPTGSGKSTTLYSILNQMNQTSRNILTIEDPVEYQVEGVTQLQVNPEIGLTFPNALRAFLRQAPDVVLVGEIRDSETADIAIKASLTGQIVLSTLHTNDAPSAIVRLADMGVDPFLLASSLIFVAAQRLCRQICPQCKAAVQVPPDALELLGERLPAPTPVLYRGRGCSYCRGTGFRGRFAILEAMSISDPIREMIIAGRSTDELKAYAQKHGMRTLRQEGVQHLLAGRTSLEEVIRVTGQE